MNEKPEKISAKENAEIVVPLLKAYLASREIKMVETLLTKQDNNIDKNTIFDNMDKTFEENELSYIRARFIGRMLIILRNDKKIPITNYTSKLYGALMHYNDKHSPSDVEIAKGTLDHIGDCDGRIDYYAYESEY